MNETYVECLVKRKTPGYMSFLKILLIMLTVGFVLVGMVFIIALIPAILFGVAAYFVYMNTDLEYEYLYLDRELMASRNCFSKSRMFVTSAPRNLYILWSSSPTTHRLRYF